MKGAAPQEVEIDGGRQRKITEINGVLGPICYMVEENV